MLVIVVFFSAQLCGADPKCSRIDCGTSPVLKQSAPVGPQICLGARSPKSAWAYPWRPGARSCLDGRAPRAPERGGPSGPGREGSAVKPPPFGLEGGRMSGAPKGGLGVPLD